MNPAGNYKFHKLLLRLPYSRQRLQVLPREHGLLRAAPHQHLGLAGRRSSLAGAHVQARRAAVPVHATHERAARRAAARPHLHAAGDHREDSRRVLLWSTAGEKPKKAIKPEVVGEYAQVSNHGQLKYVVNGTQQSWDEVEEHTEAFRNAGVDWDVWIMPVGATKEEQEQPQIAEIAVEAMKRGYHVSGRLHCYVFGNQIGT